MVKLKNDINQFCDFKELYKKDNLTIFSFCRKKSVENTRLLNGCVVVPKVWKNNALTVFNMIQKFLENMEEYANKNEKKKLYLKSQG